MDFVIEQGGGSETISQVTQELKEFSKLLRLEIKDFFKQITADWKENLFQKGEEFVETKQLFEVTKQDVDKEQLFKIGDRQETSKMESDKEAEMLKAGSILPLESDKEKLRMDKEELWKDSEVVDGNQFEESGKEENLKSQNNQRGKRSDIGKERFAETVSVQKIGYPQLQILDIKTDGVILAKELLLIPLLLMDIQRDWKRFKKKRLFLLLCSF